MGYNAGYRSIQGTLIGGGVFHGDNFFKHESPPVLISVIAKRCFEYAGNTLFRQQPQVQAVTAGQF